MAVATAGAPVVASVAMEGVGCTLPLGHGCGQLHLRSKNAAGTGRGYTDAARSNVHSLLHKLSHHT